MRVISGIARGTKLNSIESMSTRPTLDRVRESLFNIIQNDIKDSVLLDLFAGSGAVGLEAISRGAKKAVLCDKNKKAIEVINKNVKKIRAEEKVQILCIDYENYLKT